MSIDRLCGWCRKVALDDPRARFCSRRCRQTAFRLRRRAAQGDASLVPSAGRFAYADPPYPGLAARYYRHEPTFAGEVDHRELIASLESSGYAGWALSTSEKALRDVLPLCPPTARVCPWVKPIGAAPRTRGIHGTWEPLIVVGGRQRQPGVRNWLRAAPARGGGETLMGRKPLIFCAWLFDLLGMVPGDELVDLFPGTGVVSRAWAELSRGAPGDLSRGALHDASGEASPDASFGADADASFGADGDASFGADGDVSQEYFSDAPPAGLPRGIGDASTRRPHKVNDASPGAAPRRFLRSVGLAGDPSCSSSRRRVDASASRSGRHLAVSMGDGSRGAPRDACAGGGR